MAVKQGKELRALAAKIVPILQAVGVRRAGLFGSYARGDARTDSDVDVLILPPKGFDLLDLGGLVIQLRSVLKKEVGVVTYGSLDSRIKERVLSQEVRII